MPVFIKGALIGFAIAAPVGPIGVLCIQRTLALGWAYGIASGLGAATADAVYGLLAGLGLTMLSQFVVSQQHWLRLFGGVFLLYLGTRTIFARPAETASEIGKRKIVAAYGSTLALTITNPLTILSFAAIFAGAGVNASMDHGGAGLLVLGVFVGSASWWLILSSVVGMLREQVNDMMRKWVNRLAGLALIGFALFVFIHR